MINTDTIRFILMMNELAEKSKNGFLDWHSTDSVEELNGFPGIIYDSKACNRIIQDKLVEPEGPHKDIISYYDYNTDNECVRVEVSAEENDFSTDALYITAIIYRAVDAVGNQEEAARYAIINGTWYEV